MLKTFAENIVFWLAMGIKREQNPVKKHQMTLTALRVAKMGDLGLNETMRAVTKGEQDLEKAKRN